MVLTASEKLSKEYSAIVVKLGPVAPVEGSDFLGYTLVEGFPIVVRKDQVSEGDLMIYCQNETALNLDFLGANNNFDWENKEKNANYKSEILPLLETGNKDEAKKKCGFVNKYGRIRMIRLRGQVSMGILFPKAALVAWKPKLESLNLEDYLGQDFDTVDGELFCKAFVRPVKEHKRGTGKKLDASKRFNRIIEGTFNFHYDTQNLQRNIDRLSPNDEVTISVKLHGTSAIFANIPVRKPKIRTEFEKHIHNWAKKKMFGKMKRQYEILSNNTASGYTEEYGNVYSSRCVIKNKYLNQGVSGGYYGADIWGVYNGILKNYIPKDYTIYGEILGYLEGEQRMIQKHYDYGCSEGKNFFMPYRISQALPDGKRKEFSIREVQAWTKSLLKEHPELSERVHPMTILFEGKLKDRYLDIPVDENWNSEILKRLERDLEFGMEGLEPMCTGHKVPREGFCLRINGDLIPECFKCKCKAFLFQEAKEMDNSDSVDIEMNQRYDDQA